MPSAEPSEYCRFGVERFQNSCVLESVAGDSDMKYAAGDYVKFEIKDDATGESEWMWLKVDRSDEPNRFVFGILDSQPILFTKNLKLGQQIAVSFDNVRDHKKASDF